MIEDWCCVPWSDAAGGQGPDDSRWFARTGWGEEVGWKARRGFYCPSHKNGAKMTIRKLVWPWVVALAVVLGSVPCQMVSAEEPLSPFLKDFVSYDRLTWEEHWVQQLDGKGGRVCHRAKFPLFASPRR